jgi:hypothetical protein
MIRFVTTLSFLVLCAWVCAAGDTDDARPGTKREDNPRRQSFDAYRAVMARNIFDATRRAWQPSAPPDPRPVAESLPSETITLVGTLIRRDGEGREKVAFFLGSQPDHTTVAQQGDTVGGLRVVDIQTSGTLLEAAETRISLPVGAALSREPGEDWERTTRPPDHVATQPVASGETDGADGAVDEILRRLLERRKEEIEQ